MNKQEAQKQIEEQRDMILDLHGWAAFGYIKGIINQLDEPPKIELPKVELKKFTKATIPQFVAEIIEYYKGQNATLYDAFREKNFNKQYSEWLMNEQDAYNKVARAWLDGYEVEKEKRYIVKIKVTGQCLGKYYINNKILSPRFIYTGRNADSFSRKELEEAGFGWVFDCSGIEVQEVE